MIRPNKINPVEAAALILNPDVTLNNDAVNKFFLSINNLGDFGIIAPISQNEKYNNFNINEDKEIKEVDNVKGFAMFLNMKNLKQINFFDDNFFLYFEEIDLCRRLKKNNSKIFIDPTIKVSHLGGMSHNSEIEKPMELSRNWHWMWSTFYFHKKHYGYLTAMIKILPKLSSSLIKFIFFLLSKSHCNPNYETLYLYVYYLYNHQSYYLHQQLYVQDLIIFLTNVNLKNPLHQ